MARKTRKRNEPKRGAGNAFTTILGASLLVTMGFALGLIAGALWEERELVAGYVLGESEEVAIVSVEEVAPEDVEVVQESAPLGIGEGQGAEPTVVAAKPPVVERQERPVEKRPPVSAAPPGGSFAIQVGAYSAETAAVELASDLRSKGFSVKVAHQGATKEKGERWRVRVGPIETRAEAEFLASRLKREEKLPTWILGGQDG